MGNIFFEITVIICLAAFLSLIFRFLKQPLILAYIVTGIIIGPLGLLNITSGELLKNFAEIGITLLLFLLGLEIKIKELPAIGKVSAVAAGLQIIIYLVLSYFVAAAFNFPPLTLLYIAAALTFSSTIIVVKLISDKHDLASLYGKISIGILLIQDLVAILLLIFLSGFNVTSGSIPALSAFLLVGIKGAFLFLAVWYLSKNIFPKVVEVLARSSESLFLVSIAWVFLLAAFVSSPFIGFSIEIGGFLAGLALANSIANYQIIAKVKILRDFFIVLFFVVLGMQLGFSSVLSLLIPALALSAFVLITKPAIIMIIVGALGYRKRTAFLSGVSLGQISEFSLILLFLGNKLGHVSNEAVSLIALVGIITFAASTYMILYSRRLFEIFRPYISIMDKLYRNKEEVVPEGDISNLSDHVILIGADQMGESILDALEEEDKDVIVIDFDPKVIKKFKEKKLSTHIIFGDISDLDIAERASLDKAKLVISTVPDIEDNLFLIEELNRRNKAAKVVVMALDSGDAKVLYKAGAEYVVLPHLAGGMHVAKIIREHRFIKKTLGALAAKDREYIS
ncbi:MAG: cation:proton antiporter [Candidatus Levybacteria bacterium]|nr:cation:proton antiporter [Candidatus Levybacteria bacterium]